MRVLWYLKFSQGQGVILPKENYMKLDASCPVAWRSISWYLMKLCST